MGLHCELAEAGLRLQHLEEQLTAQRHDELMAQLFFRINEMDDMIAQVGGGVRK